MANLIITENVGLTEWGRSQRVKAKVGESAW